MDIKKAKLPVSASEASEGDSTGGGEIKALKLTLPIEDVEKALRLIAQKTGSGDLDSAMELVYHRALSREETAQISMIVTVLRCGLQGDLFPPGYSIHDHYRAVAGGTSASPAPAGPTR